jgi:hypothetical protein
MEQHATEAENDLERTGDELEERLDNLDDKIDKSKHEAQARSEDTDPFEDAAGDWEDTDDDAGGDDPAGFDDPEADEDDDEDF